METRSASDVAQLPRNNGIVPRKAFFRKRKIVRQASENNLSLAEMNLPIPSTGRGVRPLTFDPGVLNRRVPSNASCGSVRFLCQLGHVRKKRVRLADEQTHVS